MNKVKLTVLLLVLMAAASAQSSTRSHVVRTNFLKTTDIKVEDFRIKKAVTVYDLALNLSYFHHLSRGGEREHLTLPVVIINNKPVFDKKLADIKMSEVADFTFKSGITARALYGSRGEHGVLTISLKGESTDE